VRISFKLLGIKKFRDGNHICINQVQFYTVSPQPVILTRSIFNVFSSPNVVLICV